MVGEKFYNLWFAVTMKKRIMFLVGPTAVGKSAVSVELALMIGAEIISCDSMQVYKGMDIGTAKPSPATRRRVRHHLIDIAGLDEEFSAARFREAAISAMEDILRRNKLPLFTGGTGLYIRSLLDGLCRAPSGDERLRACLKAEAEKNGKESLFRRLKEVDPKSAARIHPHDERRIIRALEVFELTNISLSRFHAERQTESLDACYQVDFFGLTMAKAFLHSRIECRVDEMFAAGFVPEVRELVKSGMGKTAGQALGYKEVIGFLEGKHSLAEAKALIKRNTRRYAKRQWTWFKKERRIKWLKLGEAESPLETARRMKNKIPLNPPFAKGEEGVG